MVTDCYKTDIGFALVPKWADLAPLTKVRLDDELIWDGRISHVKTFDITRSLIKGTHSLTIELYEKSDVDRDQALAITNLRFGGISSQRFVWQSVYRPCYPEPWATEQRSAHKDLLCELESVNYLGWNGTWSLQFNVPVFTWIHQVENLGWIYD